MHLMYYIDGSGKRVYTLKVRLWMRAGESLFFLGKFIRFSPSLILYS